MSGTSKSVFLSFFWRIHLIQGLYISIEQNYNTETVVQYLHIYEFFKNVKLKDKIHSQVIAQV